MTTQMKIVYCIALGGNGTTGSEWRDTRQARDMALGTTGAEIETPFELEVPADADPDTITSLVDDAEWNNTYSPSST